MQGVDRITGKRLSGAAHLHQSVSDILSTPIGSRVLLREYGSELYLLADSPRDELLRLRIIAATATALARWEPRLRLTRVEVTFPATEQEVCLLSVEGIYVHNQQPVRLEEIRIYGYRL